MPLALAKEASITYEQIMTHPIEIKTTAPEPKSILCVDYGTKIVGLASYSTERDPYPLPFGRIVYKNDDTLIEELSKIIEEECIDTLVVGVPYLTDGTPTKMTNRIMSFWLKCRNTFTSLNHYTQDETLSSFEAKERMKNLPQYNFKVDLKKIDELAASIILEDFVKKITLLSPFPTSIL